MKKSAIFFSKNSGNTNSAAIKIAKLLPEVSLINIEDVSFEDFSKYDFLIFGTSTWFDGELPNYWDEVLPGLEDMNFSGKKIAIFGLGNQKRYPENYQDAIGLLADFFAARGAEIVGFTSTKKYNFESSKAVKDNTFCGLALDSDMTEKETDDLLAQWIKEISVFLQ